MLGRDKVDVVDVAKLLKLQHPVGQLGRHQLKACHQGVQEQSQAGAETTQTALVKQGHGKHDTGHPLTCTSSHAPELHHQPAVVWLMSAFCGSATERHTQAQHIIIKTPGPQRWLS